MQELLLFLHSPKMKTLHFYNGIYYAWGKKYLYLQKRQWNSTIKSSFLHCVFIKHFSYDIKFPSNNSKKTIWSFQSIEFLINCLFLLYELSPYYAWYITLNIFKANYCLCYVSYFIEAVWNTLKTFHELNILSIQIVLYFTIKSVM